MAKEEQINRLRRMIAATDHIVCLLGVGMGIECGLKNRWCNEEAYRVEEEYGYSPEEIYSASFYSTKTEQFYNYYKKECLGMEHVKPSEAYHSLLKLEQEGKITACITHNIQSMAVEAGLENVIELHGSIHDNECPNCHKKYSAAYMKAAPGVPLCEVCKQPVRPHVKLRGEMIRNDKMTQAANACQAAHMILVLGTNLNHPMVKSFIRYYTGDKVVLVTKHEHYTDKQADLCIYGEVKEILPQVI